MASKERLSIASEPFFDLPCTLCSKSGRHVEASTTCLDCRQTLCHGCLKDHNKFDIMKGHRILDKATPIAGHVDLPSQICSDHGGKLIDMYCPQHDVVCCTSCAAIHHGRCDGIKYVPSVSQGTKTSQEFKKSVQNMKGLLADLQQRKKEREGDKKRLADDKGGSERNVHESAKRIIARVNNLKDKSLQQIKEKYDNFTKRVDDDLDKINDAIAALEADMKGMQPSTSDNDSQVFVVMKQSKQHAELGTNLNKKMGTSLPREALHFNVDNEIEANLKMVESLGELETPFLSSQLLDKYKIRHKKEQNECHVTGVCLMSAGTVLLTDFTNKTLKRLDSSYNIVDYCKLSTGPHDICRTGPTEVAMTICGDLKIQFVSVTSTLTLTRSFRVGENCRGIAYSRGQLFVTCGGCSQFNEGPGEVRVYSTDGKLLHNLPQKSTGQLVWSYPAYVVVSPDGNNVIVGDEKNGTVTMDRDGSNVKKIPNTEGLNYPCVQDQSLWFACGGAGTKKIYQVNDDWTSLGALLTEEDGLDAQPWSMCYQRDGDRLIVGFMNCDYIKVFKLHRK